MTGNAILDVSNEAIKYQGKSLFFQDLTLAIQRLKDLNDYSTAAAVEVGLDKIVFRHTGLKTETGIIEEGPMAFNACAHVPVIDVNSPFWNYIKDMGGSELLDPEKISEARLKTYTEKLRGTINREKSRVGGVFSKIPLKMELGKLLVHELEAAQVAAIYLHEIGHLFTFFEILTDTVSSNLAINAASEALSGADSQTERLEILHIYQRATGAKLSDGKALSDAQLNQEGYYTVLLRERTEQAARSGTGSLVYDLRGSEFAADHFASMHGSGRDLVQGLDAIYARFGVNTRQSLGAFMLTEALKVAVMIMLTIGVAKGQLMLLKFHVYFILMLINGKLEHNLYDEPAQRALRVRNNLVQALKLQLTAKERKALLEDIEFIDDLSKDMVDRRTLFNYLWVSLTPGRRRQYNQLKFQKELEQMINNNIFVSAGKLGQMTA